MNKLLGLIDRRIESKLASRSDLKLTPATVVRVDDGYLRADVRLTAGGAEIKGLLNKSGEKLKEGQTVRVAYLTLPSAGWIAMTNGEADPLKSGGGWEVDNAAILTSEQSELLIKRELMAQLTPSTALYYGDTPSFGIVQGQLAIIYNTSNGSISTIMNTIRENLTANRDYFGSSLHFDVIYKEMPAQLDITTVITNATRTATQSTKTVRCDIDITPLAEGDETYHKDLSVNVANAEFFLVPIFTSISDEKNYYGNDTPYGYAGGDLFVTLITGTGTDDWRQPTGGYTYAFGQSHLSPTRSRTPLGSEAELAFNMGLRTRSRPQEVE